MKPTSTSATRIERRNQQQPVVISSARASPPRRLDGMDRSWA